MFNVIIPSTSWAVMQQAERGETFAVFFHATGCGHCHDAREVLNGVLPLVPVTMYGINLAVDQPLAIQVGADATPTVVLFSGGQPVGKLEGSQDAETYHRFLAEGVGDDEEDGDGDPDADEEDE